MFLRRVTVTGFKSFAGKTVLNLESGITGVVGPNGSGKSNLADAIRWALGEQNKGRLRLGDREEVVFAGTDKRAKASFAEVMLVFNNEDGAFPLDLTEVEIARRLYRSGETDYRLAGRSVALRDIQALLAQAGVGANTYAVIGQGMIDSFLLSSPAERKLLFDEAAGIRGPELGREAALRKLAATTANLTRLRDIATELAPRLASLERAVSAAGEQQELEARVAQLRATVAATAIAHWTRLSENTAARLQAVSAANHRLRHERSQLEHQFAAAQAKDAASTREREQLQTSLTTREQERDQLGLTLNNHHAAVAAAQAAAAQAAGIATRLNDARAELAAAQDRQAELTAELTSNAAAAERALRAVKQAGGEVAEAQAALVAIRKGTTDGTRDQYVDHALQILKTLAVNLNAGDMTFEQIHLLIHKAGRLLSHATRTGAAELLATLKAAQKKLEAAMSKRETAVEHQTNITITSRSLEIDLTYQREAVLRAGEQVAALETQLKSLQTAAATLPQLKSQTAQTAAALAAATEQLERHREQIRQLSTIATNASQQAQLAAALERARAAALGATTEHAALKTELLQAQKSLQAAHQQAKAWNLPATARPVSASSLEDLRANLLRAETMLEAKVATYRDQTTEYTEVNTRHTELLAQITDLETAQADLGQVVTELDSLIRDRFQENFQALAEQFSHYFARLFDGGAASLSLQEADDGRYGIVIKASPRGKRLTNLAALSGGERALAGVALLAAILRVNPSPFVVLDEIDAALDEANSGRLASILTELQAHSQLIVITHNRQTMRAAKVLFGVTMSEHHVSSLLSMRLEDATALAAR